MIGAALGYGAYTVGLDGAGHWFTYGGIGVAIGLVVGRPLWSHLRDRQSTAVTSIIKAVVGCGVCVGLYAIVAKAWGGFDVTILALDDHPRAIQDWPFLLGGAIGALWGAWVEADDHTGRT